MNAVELLFLAVALAMDAFAVAVCIGLTLPKFRMKNAVIVGLYFGLFQAAMPLIGFFTGEVFAERITTIDHWIAFALLLFLGVKMIYGSFQKEEKPDKEMSLGLMAMIPLAFATSVDAFAAGVTFAFLRVNIVPAVILIGAMTFVISAVGVKVGGIVGIKFKSKAEFAGGIVLVGLAIYSLVGKIGNCEMPQ